MLEFPEMSITWVLVILIGVAGAVSWGLTQVLKAAIMGWVKRYHAVEPWFFNSTLRLCSVLLGGLVGWLMTGEATGIGVGAGAGAMNTFIVWALRRRAQKLGLGDLGQGDGFNTDPPGAA